MIAMHALDELVREAEAWARTATFRQGRSEGTTSARLTMRSKVAFDALQQELDVRLGRRLVQPQLMVLLLAFAMRRRAEFFSECLSPTPFVAGR